MASGTQSPYSDESDKKTKKHMPSILNPVLKKSKKDEEMMTKKKSVEKLKQEETRNVDIKSDLFPKINNMSYKFYGQFERDPLLAEEDQVAQKPISQNSSLQDSIFSKLKDATTKNFAEKVKMLNENKKIIMMKEARSGTPIADTLESESIDSRQASRQKIFKCQIEK